MKVGIITLYDSSNFGAYLQAYSLKKAIEKLGHNAKFIRVRSEKDTKKIFFGTLKHPRSFFKNYMFNKKKYKMFLKDRKLFEVIEKENLKDERLDVIIIGSDELWNVKQATLHKEGFYGINIDAKKKYAFAISSGSALTNDYKKYPNYIEAMKSLDNIYVRDERTKQNIKELIDKECEMVADPTFLLDINTIVTEEIMPINKKYLLVYGYSFTEKQIEYITRFAKENNLIKVSLCFKHKFCDMCLNCLPLQFSEYIKNAEYFVTTTFHGTIFSVLNKKQFISIGSSQKVDDVLKKFKLEERKVNDTEDYEIFRKKLTTIIDFKNSEKELIEWRNKSIKVLENILNE